MSGGTAGHRSGGGRVEGVSGATSTSLRGDALVTLEYRGAVRESMLAFKYHGDIAHVRWMSRHLANVLRGPLESLCAGRHDAGSAVVVTWVPTTAARRRRRGFDPAELIARSVARRLGLRPRSLLRRIDRVSQAGSSRAMRLVGPRLVARRPSPRTTASSPVVVVIDDVVTTGGSLRAARRALFSIGVAPGSVICAAVAATPSGAGR